MTVKDKVCSFDELYKAMHKCKRNVMWKDSVSGYVKNGLINCLNLHEQLIDEKYKIDKYNIFTIYEPKQREIVSTRMKDRVFQRSFGDNYLYPKMSKSFIYDNSACQIGKGTDFTMDRVNTHLQRFYRKHGLNGYVLQCDIKQFFGSTKHETAKKIVRDTLDDDWAYRKVCDIIDSFNHGDDPNVGMGLGSQITQVTQLAIPSRMDHLIKEQMKIKHYIRYMDDFVLIHEDREHLKKCLELIRKELGSLGLRLNEKKTHIFPIRQGIKFLGFRFILTDTGKVIRKLKRENITHERKKLKKLVGLSKQGILSRENVDSCYVAWKAHADRGNTCGLIKEMDSYYKKLWEEHDA